VYAGDDSDNICFTTDHTACPGGSLSVTISFGQTIDFFQPLGVGSLDAHTATSGTSTGFCPTNCTPDGKFNKPGSGNMVGGTDYKVNFDGTAGLGSGTYTFYCTPHGNTMTGTITVIADTTTTSPVTRTSGPNPSVAGQSLQFKTTVSNNIIPGTIPTGGVTFKDFGVPITANLPLDGTGSATLTTTSLAGGNHSITAVYTPDVTNFSGSNSNASPLSQDVQDFSITISNPAGAALPCPGGPPCPAGESYDYNGTLAPIHGYTGSATISCQGSAPSSCLLVSPANPVAMNTPFTIRASHTSAASTPFSFSIQGIGTPTPTVPRTFPVTLNVGSFNFAALSPNTVSVVQGNPSSPMAFQISSLGSFSGEVDMSCVSPPSGVTCLFSNGSSTQPLLLSPGQTINDTLTLNTTNSVAVSSYPITVQATPVASPGNFQQRTVTLNEIAGVNTVKTILYFGAWLAGQTDQPLNVLPVFPAPSSPPGGYITATLPIKLEIWGGQLSFKVSASNWSPVSADAQGAQLFITFSEPVLSATANVTAGTDGGESCGSLVSGVSITCNLVTVPFGDINGSWTKEVTVSVAPPVGRFVGVTAEFSTTSENQIYTDSKSQTSTNVIHGTTQTRPRPMVQPGQKPGNTNPK